MTKIDRLLTRFGFEKSEQANHMKYRHELLPTGAVVTVPRHRRVRGYVARSAVAAVDSVVAAEKAKAGANEEGSTQ
ncbi:MAG: type II toxin-antitoxin system HicA family toxin [Gemmatimonadota bacterium]